MNLSVVIPAYNEEDNILKAVCDVIATFPKSEIVVVNDKSTDQTQHILDVIKNEYADYGVTFKFLENEKNMGHGASVIRGLREATRDYILYIDADRQIDLKNVFKVEAEEFDVLTGYRVDRYDKLFRKVISFCLKTTNLLFNHVYIKDANCPFKIYRKTSLQPLINRLPESYVIPIACLQVLARKSDLKVLEISVEHHPYEGIRKGFLQAINFKTVKFFLSAFKETISL